jgi:hypothetical protein
MFPDNEELRPELAGQEEAASISVVRDAVQHVGTHGFVARQQTGPIDLGEDLACLGIDSQYSIRLPHVREHFAADALKLVEQKLDAVFPKGHAAGDGQARGITERQAIATVAHDQAPAVVAEPAARALVFVALDRREGGDVVDIR